METGASGPARVAWGLVVEAEEPPDSLSLSCCDLLYSVAGGEGLDGNIPGCADLQGQYPPHLPGSPGPRALNTTAHSSLLRAHCAHCRTRRSRQVL